jgi:hypothetical protein
MNIKSQLDIHVDVKWTSRSQINIHVDVEWMWLSQLDIHDVKRNFRTMLIS